MNARRTLGFLFLLSAWLLCAAPVVGQPWRVLGDSRGAFPLDSVALSPDGKFLLAGDYAGVVKRTLVLDAANGTKVRELGEGGQRFAFSPDSRLVYVGTLDRKVGVWELKSGKKLQEFQADNLALSADGKVLLLLENRAGLSRVDPGANIEVNPLEIVAPPTSVVRFMDTATWKEQGQLSMELISALAISGDGKTAAWAAADAHIHLVDVASRKEIRKLPIPRSESALYTSSVPLLAWAPDGKTLAAVIDAKKVSQFGNFMSTISVWDPKTGKEIKQLEGPEVPVRGLAYSPRGDRLVATGPGRHWMLYAMPDGELIEKSGGRRGHGDLVLALYRQGSLPTEPASPFLSYLWDLARGKDIESGDTPEGLSCLAALPDGKTVATGEMGGFLRFWDLKTGKEIRRIDDGVPKTQKWQHAIYGLAYSPADKCLVASLHTGDLKFARADNGKREHVLRSMGGGPKPFAVARDGQIAAVRGDANGPSVRIWANRAARPDSVRIVAGAISSMQFSDDGKLLIVASWNGLHVIDVPGKKVLRVLEPTKRFDSAALSPDGTTLATQLQFEDAVRLWHVDSGHEIGKIAVTPSPAGGTLYFAPDGRSLLVQNKDGMVVWEVATGQVRYSAPGTARSQGFSPNGRLIFAIAAHLWWIDNKQVFVWDVTGAQTGGVLKPVKHTPQIQADLWADLQPNVDAGKAYRALWRLAADPDQTIAFLTEKVAAIGPVDPRVTPLDTHPAPPARILAYRIVELLEQIGTPEARRLLETLATPAKPQFTDAARQALARLPGK